MQTTNHLLKLSLKQWTLYLTSCEKWMCTFIQDSALPYSFSQLTKVGAELVRNSVSGVQQVRSLYLNEVQKLDIDDAKNHFRGQVSKFISKENAVTDKMSQLEENVLRDIKDWVVGNETIMYREDAIWKHYV